MRPGSGQSSTGRARGAAGRVVVGPANIPEWGAFGEETEDYARAVTRRIFAKLSVCTRAEMVAQLFATPHLLSGD